MFQLVCISLCSLYMFSHFSPVVHVQSCLRFCTVQIVVTVHSDGANSKHKFCFKTGKTTTETFQLIKQAYGYNAVYR
jgi:hypothetical protein